MSDYLTDLPTDIINDTGMQKTLFTRRETIYLKHIMKNVFEYGTEDELNEKLKMMQFKSQFKYMQFLTHKLRGIYKITRNFKTESADAIVKTDRESVCRVLELYKPIKPLIIIDFDRTITNQKFHNLYRWIADDFEIVINSGNPDKDGIIKYLEKWNLRIPKEIYANKGKQKKIVNLKVLSQFHLYSPIFYFDDETEYLDYGVMLDMYCYHYTKDGECNNYTFFRK